MELVKLDDSAKTHIRSENVFGRFVRDGYRVTWIEWDSAFRETDLQIGDLVVALNGEAYTGVDDGNKNSSAVGMYGEGYFWEQKGGKEGDRIVLTVVRDGKEFDIEGQLRAHRFYYTAEGKTAIAPGGPERMVNDGFSGPWSGWYEQTTKEWSYILNDGWNRYNLNNRQKLAEQLENEPRLQYLQDNYPGPFADTMRADYDRVIAYLRGKRYELTEDDLAYRELGEKRAQIAAEAAQTAWKNILNEVSGELITTFPAPEPDKREEVVGKIVELPWMIPRQMVNDLGRTYGVFGGRYDGYYFIDLNTEQGRRFFDIYYHYRGLVNPNLRERYGFLARILDEPRMITYQGDAVTGLLVDIVAARVGEGEGEMFTDLRNDPPDTFAGEEQLKALVKVGELSDDLPPEGVMEVVIRAVQQADMETWKKAFADWRAWSRSNEEVYLNRAYTLPDHLFVSPWEQSRRVLLKEVYDSRISKVSDVITLAEENAELGTPRVQQVTVYVDHIGLFEGEYRPFNNINVTRPWTLQRLGDGPWRIVDIRHL
jgi:hypothetical protein